MVVSGSFAEADKPVFLRRMRSSGKGGALQPAVEKGGLFESVAVTMVVRTA